MTELAVAGERDESEADGATDANLPRVKYALVITNMLNPSMVQGFPLFAKDVDHAHEIVEQCVMDGMPVHIYDDKELLLISLILGSGQTYQIQPWDQFEGQMNAMKRKQAEAEQAARFGVAPTINGGGPRRA